MRTFIVQIVYLNFLLFSSNSFTLLDAVRTNQYPAVGRLVTTDGLVCTATLISPNIVLTAAHCMEFKTGNLMTNPFNKFRIEVENTTYSYSFISIWSFIDKSGDNDVAIVLLVNQVPSKLVTPMKILAKHPNRWVLAAIIGFGCASTEWSETQSQYAPVFDDPFGEKRIVYRKVGDKAYQTCEGDSGGPWFDTLGEGIYAVSSTGNNLYSVEELRSSQNSTSFSGNVSAFYNQIMSKVNYYSSACSINHRENGTMKYYLGQCISTQTCKLNGNYSEEGFCPNSHADISCCHGEKDAVR